MIDIVYRFEPAHRPWSPPPATAADARRRLEDGNRQFAALLASAHGEGAAEPHVIPFDVSHVEGETASGAVTQAPFAVVLGCSDARVPTELIFGQAYNDLFVVRVAGNVLGSVCLGSVDYAAGHLGESLKLLVVVGHTGCGAVVAAVSSFLQPGRYLELAASHALRSVVDPISIDVRAAARALETVHGRDVSLRPGYGKALVETSVVVNAAVTAHTLELEFAGRSGCEVVYGVYDLATHVVGVPAAGPAEEAGLHAPPRDRDGFVALLTGVASSARVRRALESEEAV
jgi:carbonic anhydrase